MARLVLVFMALSSSLAMAQSARISSVTVGYDSVGIGLCAVSLAVASSSNETVYVGMTARKPDGTEYDFPAQDIRPSVDGTQVNFRAIIGLGYTEYVISVWSRKIMPCNSDRPGCKKYGYVLDGQLASTGWTRM